jgi:hypothetical protein
VSITMRGLDGGVGSCVQMSASVTIVSVCIECTAPILTQCTQSGSPH